MKWFVGHLLNDEDARALTKCHEDKADAVEEYRQHLLNTRTRTGKTPGTWQRCEGCDELTEQIVKVDMLWNFRLCETCNTPEKVSELFVLSPNFEEWRS